MARSADSSDAGSPTSAIYPTATSTGSCWSRAGFVDTKHVVAYTDRDLGSVVEYDRDPDRLWAEVSFPADEPEGTYLPHFRAEVTMIEEGLPWRSGVTGIARALYTATTAAIGAFTPLWDLLPGQDD